MSAKDVLLLLTDKWADWEASYAIAEVNSVPQYSIKTIALDKGSKASIGGLRAEIDVSIKEYTDLSNLALVILPGGFSWQDNRYEEIAQFVKQILEQNIPVAAICGATIFLGSHGLLDQVKHTGDSFKFFEEQDGYNGAANYLEAQVVRDKNIITANETAAVDFAYEIYKLLEIDEPKELEDWYDYFKNGFVRSQ
ncbi:type 1 glutamine amidotransferase family protein [Carnobacterium inhibens]|uniref:Thiazole biosynthesis protein ThiJ n=1 Tax=Carnobacterium inhibens subsp. gilichinskyi TaxID=1266845 RepID=U5SAN4_9LACT|nr:type 1 glutamine amidotransferase family protein [Carnobacterium inhibens]AGY81123.1 thiazole biosynthesis protein ThiJ [Carnobacterium inhibens subsp. gilichinskyi]